jgi:hypothetical protein
MSSSDRSAAANSAVAASTVTGTSFRPAPDKISTEGAAFLTTSLASQPEVRPEEVARATALAADPNYPSLSIMKSVAGQILASPDLSEDES